jgi:hypothetical protein
MVQAPSGQSLVDEKVRLNMCPCLRQVHDSKVLVQRGLQRKRGVNVKESEKSYVLVVVFH